MIDEIKGTKSTKIMELINRKLQKDKDKMLSKHVKDTQLKILEKDYFTAEDIMIKAKEKLDKRKEELDLKWESYNKKYKIVDKCRISKEDYELLQNAQDLYSIGKQKEANQIWAEMIEKHKLFKE
jgi:hypothetical protein